MERTMLNVKLEGNKMTVEEFNYPTDVFEIVETFPKGYTIWNIGNHMPKGYLPLAQVKDHKVNTNTLKALKINNEDWETLMYATHYSCNVRSLKKWYEKRKDVRILKAAELLNDLRK